ncbi:MULTISPECIES: hypothetical protein [unclassified Streptomyces]|jgi:hypothetical protein|uniref:hypothetical protein n=1 Tax=unclassified Streptomyces TaxID=2593676 RepID=UPI000851B7C9|nr:hypothetical protein [Streptomyces sp. LUP47B]MBW8818546.1 hypothetical protein [Streptomyces sp.]
MGTKTADETGAETGAKATTDEEKVSVAKTDEVTEAEDTSAEDTAADEIDDEDDLPEATREEGPTGVGQGAGAVVSAALGLVSLTGSWVGTVASARQSLVGQLHAQTATSSDVAKLLDEGYGDAWKATALWGGVFALIALVVGVGVLARPAFGAPGKPQATWIKSVAWGGVALGVVGLLLAVLKYTDLLLDLPSAS